MLIFKSGNIEEVIIESNYEKYEELNGTALQISFSSFNFEQNVGYELIDFNATIEDEDGHEYKVKQLTKTATSKNAIASHIYYELVGHRKYESFTGTHNFNTFATWLFNGTGWAFVNDDVNETLTFNNFGNDNCIQLIQRLITKFNCEMQILPGKVIRFAKRIGQDNDKQYRFKHNIKEISQSVDTTNVRTRIMATGANGLTVYYSSPLASNPLFGVLDAEPIEDNSIADQNELLELAKSSLNDVPETNIDASVLDTDGNVGDYVWVIHEEMGLEYQARILSKRTKRNYEESTVEIGNTKKRTIEDALLDQKEEVKENKEAIDEVSQTLTETESDLRAEITQTASSIRLEVEHVSQSVATLEITATQIQSNVTNLQNYTQSSITQLSDNINLKVDKGGTITDINLTPGTATINADKINLNGAVMVNGSITGSSNIVVSNSAAIGNALYFGGFRGSFDFIEVSGGDMTFNSLGDFNFSGGNVYINGRKVMTE